MHTQGSSADKEYTAWKDGCTHAAAGTGSGSLTPPALCPADTGTNIESIIFNVCGTVSKAIAPVECADPSNPTAATCWQQPAPLPHSHGIAVQFIESDAPIKQANGQAYQCVDMDTCDQATNYDINGVQCGIPTQAAGGLSAGTGVGTPNYPGNAFQNPNIPGSTSDNVPQTNPYRETYCLNNPTANVCKTQGVPCTGQAEILAYYDGVETVRGDTPGSPPIFSLTDETNPSGGINLTYLGALPWKAWAPSTDTDRCSAIDPATGYNVQRSVNIYIGCDKSAKGLNVIDYTERGQCQYYIRATSSVACGAAGDPFEGKYYPSDMAWLWFGSLFLMAPFCYIGASRAGGRWVGLFAPFFITHAQPPNSPHSHAQSTNTLTTAAGSRA